MVTNETAGRPKGRHDDASRKGTDRRGDHPKTGLPHKLLKIGQRICPECRGELEPSGESSVYCLDCGTNYPVGGVP